jgi:hypothetical protein
MCISLKNGILIQSINNTQFTFLKTCNHYLKANLRNIYDIFWDFLNIHLNIIVSKEIQRFLIF